MGLLWPVGQLRTLKYVVITGNPFAIAADLHLSTRKLEQALAQKQGQLVNESLNPPTFVKSRAGTSSYSNAGASRGKPQTVASAMGGTDSTRPNTFHQNYNYNQLVKLPEEKQKNATGLGWAKAGAYIEGKPLAIAYNSAVMQDQEDGEDEFPSAPVDQPEETAFFITEDVRKQAKGARGAQDIDDVVEEAQSKEQSIDEANMRRRKQ